MRFGVNRHTVRSAIASLVREGVLRAEQGRGTFAVGRKRLTYPIARRTRFSAGLRNQAHETLAYMLRSRIEPAEADIAAALGVEPGASLIRLESLSEADGVPISRATTWFESARFAGIASLFQSSGSMTATLAGFGIADYVRRSTTITARHAGDGDIADLKLSPGAIVLETAYVSAEPDGRPFQYSLTRFAADRVAFEVDHRES